MACGVGFAENVLALGVELVESFGAIHEIGERYGELLGRRGAYWALEAKAGGALLKASNGEFGAELFASLGEHNAVSTGGGCGANEAYSAGIVLPCAVDLELKVVDVLVIGHDSRLG